VGYRQVGGRAVEWASDLREPESDTREIIEFRPRQLERRVDASPDRHIHQHPSILSIGGARRKSIH